jgi:putative transposase
LFDAHKDDPEFGYRYPVEEACAKSFVAQRYHRASTREGKLYICAVKDIFSNRIVGYCMDSRMKSRLATTALHSAVARRGEVADCILHTDRGSQFRSRKFVQALGGYDMVGSMGRVGAAGDNEAMESFFSLLQKNVLERRRWDTREELRIAIVTWIESTHHRRRRQAALGRLTPIEFEAIMTTPTRPRERNCHLSVQQTQPLHIEQIYQ